MQTLGGSDSKDTNGGHGYSGNDGGADDNSKGCDSEGRGRMVVVATAAVADWDVGALCRDDNVVVVIGNLGDKKGTGRGGERGQPGNY